MSACEIKIKFCSFKYITARCRDEFSDDNISLRCIVYRQYIGVLDARSLLTTYEEKQSL